LSAALAELALALALALAELALADSVAYQPF
jgi:hypothetical protein